MNELLFFISVVSLFFTSLVIVNMLKIEDNLKKIISFFSICGLNVYANVMVLGFIIQKLNIYTVTSFHVVLAVILGILASIKKTNLFSFKKVKEKVNNFKLTKKHYFFIAIIIIFLGLTIFKGTIMINTRENSADGRNYHIPVLYDYIQMEKIAPTSRVVWSEGYPKNMEMLNLWTLIYAPSAKILRTPQLLIALLGALAVASILKKFKAKDYLIPFGSLIFFVSPFILSQTTTTYLDGSMISIFMLSLYFLLEYLDNKKTSDLILMSALTGFMVGMKSSGIAYGGISIVMLLLYLFFIEKQKIKDLIKPTFIIGGIIVLFGGAWYLWNFLRFDNPLFPFGMLFFEGYDVNERIMIPMTPDVIKGKNILYQLFYSWYTLPTNAVIAGNDTASLISRLIVFSCDQRLGGMGALWSIILFPSIIIYIVISIIKKINLTTKEWLITIIIILSFIITPASWWARYSGFIVLLGIIAFVKLIPLIKNKFAKSLIFVSVLASLGLTILQGTYTDYQIYKYKEADAYFLKDINDLINKEEPLKILVFEKLKEENYLLLQGNTGQNIVKTYYSEDDLKYISKYLQHYNINTNQDISKILEEESDFDYILVYEKESYFSENSEFEKVLVSHLGNFYQKNR